jgi:hypothetical protein
MSRKDALANVQCMAAPRWAHSEFSLEYHQAYARGLTGADPSTPSGARALYDAWAIDFLWRTDDGLHGDWPRRGRATDMGHAEYAEAGADMRQPRASPFTDVHEVWAFDPVAEYGVPRFEDQVAAYEALDRDARASFPDQLVTGGYYKTIVSGAIEAFGWEMFLEAAADRAKIETVFDRFFQRTLFHVRAWAATAAEVFIQHDDFVWTAGAFLAPEMYRKVIIPRYAELWKTLHAAGKRVLFCSDGNWTDLAQDIAAAGADGFIFEPCVDWRYMTERFGGSHCLVGSAVDCRDLTPGSRDSVEHRAAETFACLRGCRGAVVAVGNHLPANIPPGIMELYRAAVLRGLPRS